MDIYDIRAQELEEKQKRRLAAWPHDRKDFWDEFEREQKKLIARYRRFSNTYKTYNRDGSFQEVLF